MHHLTQFIAASHPVGGPWTPAEGEILVLLLLAGAVTVVLGIVNALSRGSRRRD